MLLVAGVVCLGVLGYAYVGSNVVAHRAQGREVDRLRDSWVSAEPVPPGATRTGSSPAERSGQDGRPGTAVALLRVPRFGASYEVPIVEGTSVVDLARGVGHYDGTAQPGGLGNFALAGHRVTHGEPFARLLELRRGDEVVVEDRQAVFTYVIDTSPADLTVKDTDGWVIDPVPHQPDTTPTQALLTLTTCQDLFHSPDRSVGFGHLEYTRDK